MKERFPDSFGEGLMIQNEAIEGTDKIRVRPDVFREMDEQSAALGLLLEKYSRGESIVTEEGEYITDRVFKIVDSCVLFSEYQYAGEIFSRLERQYPKLIEENFRKAYQDNPIPGFRDVLLELKIPVGVIHTEKKNIKYLGFRNHNTERSAEEYQKMLGLTDEEIKGQKILDIGAGSATFARRAKQMGLAEVISIDANSNAVDIHADWQHLPLKDESFDRVVSVFAFPAWVKNWRELESALQEIIRVVKTGGTVELVPGAPIFNKGDFDAKTRSRWKKLGVDMRDTINRAEFEQVLAKFQDEVEISFGEPTIDTGTFRSPMYVPLILKKR